MDYTEFITGVHNHREDSLKEQLVDLIPVAGKLGLTDAAKFLESYTASDGAVLSRGTEIWYVDLEEGEIEQGSVYNTNYQGGVLVSFSVEFANGDFDEFIGEAYGSSFFPSREAAEAARLMGQE